MPPTYIYAHPTLGNIDVKETARCTRIHLTFGTGVAGNGLTLTVPVGTSVDVIDDFFSTYLDAILKKMKKIESRTAPGQKISVGHTYVVGNYTIKVVLDRENMLNVKDKVLTLKVSPRVQAMPEESFQNFFYTTMSNTFRKLAFIELAPQVLELAHRLKYPVSTVDVRNMKTRWGSCSSAGRICLNTILIFLPSHLRQSVILHELTHLHHMDHGPKFKAELDSLNRQCNGHTLTQIETEMKNYSTTFSQYVREVE